MQHSVARPSEHRSTVPCAIYILPFASQVNHRSTTPSPNLALKSKVTFCVQGVIPPLLSNLVLDELDRELERRGHRFVRYADDCNIYVRSEAAGHRVMASITRFIEPRVKLQVNAEKSAVGRPWQRSFLGYTLREDSEFRRCVAEKALARFKSRVRELTRRSRGVSLERAVGDLNLVLARLGRVFRSQSVARAVNARCLGAAASALLSLGAMEDDAPAHWRAVSSRGRQVGGLCGGASGQGAVATECLPGLAQCVR